MHTHSWGKTLQRDIFLPLFVAHGVTGIREMDGDVYDLEHRGEIAEGTLLGPRMVVASPNVDGPNPWPAEDIFRVVNPREAHEAVDSLKARGYDLVQTSQFLSPVVYRALHERGREVGMEVSGRLPLSVSLWGVELACSSREEELRIEYRQRVKEISADTSLRTHVPFWNRTEWEPLASIDPQKCRAVYSHLAAQGTWVVPTLMMQRLISHHTDPDFQNHPMKRYLPAGMWDPTADAEWFDPEGLLLPIYEHRMRTLVHLHRAGVGILAGSDAGSSGVFWGISLHPKPCAANGWGAPRDDAEGHGPVPVVLGAVSGNGLTTAESWADRAPDRFLKGIVIFDPLEDLDVDAFIGWVEGGRLDVFAEIGAQYGGYSPSDPAFEPYWSVAVTHGIPVGIHTGGAPRGTPYKECCPNFRLRLGDPLLLEDMLVAHPDLKIFVMHAGDWFYERTLQLMQMYPHVHAEVGVLGHVPEHQGTETLARFLERAKAFGVLDRVMFGSDQMVWPEAIGISIEAVQSLEFLTADEKEAILYGNAARFLELSEETIARHRNIANQAETKQ